MATPLVQNSRLKTRAPAFTLIELLVVLAIIGTLAGLMLPVLARSRDAARASICGTRLHQMGLAMQMYVNDNNEYIFPLKEVLPEGTLWWFGFEDANGPTAEGQRILDRTRGRLWRYYTVTDTVEICPSFRTDSPRYKPKYNTNWTTYGVPQKLMNPAAPTRVRQVTQPTLTLAFADAAQINTFQAPASPANPMFEQWYYVSKLEQVVHYVHDQKANGVMFDGHVQTLHPEFGVNLTFPEAPVGRPPSSVLLQVP